MSSLARAIEELTPLLHSALTKAARPTLPFKFEPHPHALATVPGSLEPYLSLPGAPALPYANALAAVLADAMPEGPNARGVWLSDEAPAEKADGDREEDTYTKLKNVLPFNAPLWTSKAGGFGYLPRDFPYPRNTANNRPLQLLVQLNLSELAAQAEALAKTKAKSTGPGADTGFLPSPPWPHKGILAVYIDPFDCGTWGLNFVARDPQVGYRFVYFENDYEEKILPLLREYLASATGKASGDVSGVTALEAQLLTHMWSREEQYAVFEAERVRNPQAAENGLLSFQAAADGDTEGARDLAADKELLYQVGWLLAAGTVTPTDHARTGAGVQKEPPSVPYMEKHFPFCQKSNSLWYGEPMIHEFVLTVDTDRMLQERAKLEAVMQKYPDLFTGGTTAPLVPLMVPTRSVEFNQQVLYRALRGPHGRELVHDIALTAQPIRDMIARQRGEKDKREGCTANAAETAEDPLDEVDVQYVSYFDLREKRLEALKRKAMAKKAQRRSPTSPDDAEEDDEDEDMDDGQFDQYFSNQVGGYPAFTQEDLRYAAYSRHDGGFNDEGSQGQRGMLIFPEKHVHENEKKAEATAAAGDIAPSEQEVQRDPDDGAVMADYCLFQLAECSELLMVGDAGIANAFISEKDLRDRRFDRAWFSFDCC